ncbi:MAG TPA: PP0621 family protein [Usitatibacter sp.]|nr:PP0621 family protein [Usitatibacter sp.]
MGRILTLLIIGVALWWLFRGFFRSQVRGPDKPLAKSPQGEDMVRCARCGVNLPRSEAREEGGKLVCASNPQCR